MKGREVQKQRPRQSKLGRKNGKPWGGLVGQPKVRIVGEKGKRCAKGGVNSRATVKGPPLLHVSCPQRQGKNGTYIGNQVGEKKFKMRKS